MKQCRAQPTRKRKDHTFKGSAQCWFQAVLSSVTFLTSILTGRDWCFCACLVPTMCTVAQR
eukprot:3790812-Amphidinium_carterae.1